MTHLLNLAGCLTGVLSIWSLLIMVTPQIVLLSISQDASLNGGDRWWPALHQHAVAMLCAGGVCLSALLNGFGSVSMPYTCLAGLLLQPIPVEAIHNAQQELKNLEGSIAEKQSQASSATAAASSGAVHNSRPAAVVQKEVQFLYNLRTELSQDVEEIRTARTMAIQARTHRFQSYIGIAFSLLLLFRLYSAVMQSLWFRGASERTTTEWKSSSQDNGEESSDLVTSILIWLSTNQRMHHHHPSEETAARIDVSLSLGITIVLGCMQLRTFLLMAAMIRRRLVRLWARFAGSPPNEQHSDRARLMGRNKAASRLPSFFIAICLGCYWVACLVMIKSLLPARYSRLFLLALRASAGGIVIHTSLLNTVYAASAGACGILFGLALGIQRQNVYRHLRQPTMSGSNKGRSSTGSSLAGLDAV